MELKFTAPSPPPPGLPQGPRELSAEANPKREPQKLLAFLLKAPIIGLGLLVSDVLMSSFLLGSLSSQHSPSGLRFFGLCRMSKGGGGRAAASGVLRGVDRDANHCSTACAAWKMCDYLLPLL